MSNIILEGTFSEYHLSFICEYITDYAEAGLPAYYTHRGRFKGDGLKKQLTRSELPIPAPICLLGADSRTLDIENTDFFADVVITETFEEVLAYLPRIQTNLRGGDWYQFREQRKRIQSRITQKQRGQEIFEGI